MSDSEFPKVISRPRSDTMPSPGVLQFQGGNVAIPKPTRADLALSAKQWATAVREELQDWEYIVPKGKLVTSGEMFASEAIRSKLDRLDAVLAELEAMCR